MMQPQSELYEAAQEVIVVAEKLMAELNDEAGKEIAPGPRWKEAFFRLKSAVEHYYAAPK